MKKPASLLVLGAVVLAPLFSALAADPVVYKNCTGGASADDTEAAKGLYSAGKTAYNEADYQTAIRYWRDSFDRDCSAPAMLLNLANAYEKAGNVDAAIVSLETYLKRKPTADDAPTIQKRIENMKKARASAPATTSAAPPPASAPTAKPTAAPSATPAPSSAPPASTDSSKGPGVAPWIVVGVGGAVFLVGGLVYLGGKGKVSDADQACPTRSGCTQDVQDKGNSGRKSETTGSVLAAVGVVGVAGGLAWYFLTKPKDASSSYITPQAAPGYAGLMAGGSFLGTHRFSPILGGRRVPARAQ